MLFDFIKYINPIWYWNLTPQTGDNFFANYSKLNKNEKSIISYSDEYEMDISSKLDAAYQAWHKGIITNNSNKLIIDSDSRPTLTDNYRFAMRYFNPIWSYYIFFLRIFTLHNPIKEFIAFKNTRGIKRIDLYNNIFPHENEFFSFESKMLKKKPFVSVVIPTLNRYEYLKDVIEDLEKQDYKNFDLIVIDQSNPFDSKFYEKFNLNIKVVNQTELALWLARNTAIKMSAAELILLFDDDSRVEADWISNHVKCIDYFNADISSGVSLSKIGAKIPKNYEFFRWADQIDTGNVMIKKQVFKEIGLFDRQFEKQRMGDGEYGMRAYMHGFKNISNPLAHRIHLKAGTGGLRQMGSWDGFRPKKLFAPRPIPSVVYFFRKYFGNELTIYGIIIGTLPSIIPYKYKKSSPLLLIGTLISIFLFPLILIQLIRSWRLASKKIEEGAKIEKL